MRVRDLFTRLFLLGYVKRTFVLRLVLEPPFTPPCLKLYVRESPFRFPREDTEVVLPFTLFYG